MDPQPVMREGKNYQTGFQDDYAARAFRLNHQQSGPETR